jgi:hypothetical protein
MVVTFRGAVLAGDFRQDGSQRNEEDRCVQAELLSLGDAAVCYR